MTDTRLAYNGPPNGYNPEVFLICSECCKTFKGTLEEMIRLGWSEYIGNYGKVAICPGCERKSHIV
jgi:hypothetical protein